jgi:hypothetical protein
MSVMLLDLIVVIFIIFEIAKAMDLKFAGLNYQGLEAIRSVQGKAKYERGYIPSATSVKRSCRQLEKYMKTLGLEPKTSFDSTLNAEVVSFDTNALLRFLIRQYGLEDIAKNESIYIGLTSDGARFTNNVGHTTIGFKLIDGRAKNPLTGNRLHDDIGYQSVQHCFPIRTILASEDRSLFENQFGDIYSFMKKAAEKGLPECELGPALKPFVLIAPHDGKACIEVVGRGGGAKMIPYFCPYCSIKSDQLCKAISNDETDSSCTTTQSLTSCERGCEGVPGKACRHWMIETDDTIKLLQEQFDTKRPQFEYSLSPAFRQALTKLPLMTVDDAPDSDLDPFHINFKYRNVDDIRAIKVFYNAVWKHIQVRKNYHTSFPEFQSRAPNDLESIRQMLEGVVPSFEILLKNEAHFGQINDKLQRHAQSHEYFLLAIESMIIDSMHLLNRTVEKIIRMLLVKGVQNNATRKKNFMTNVENVVNGSAWHVQGNPDTSSVENKTRIKWRFPESKVAGQSVGAVSLSFQKAKRFMSSMHLLYPVCFPSGGAESESFRLCVEMYKEIMIVIEKKTDLSNDEVDALQNKIDAFGDLWIELCGDEGMSNYMHYLISGHVCWFIRKYGNLYKFNQQGWESLNWKLKAYYFRRTQRGGHGSGGKYLLPIYLFLTRRLAWATGIGDLFFQRTTNQLHGNFDGPAEEELYESIAVAISV